MTNMTIGAAALVSGVSAKMIRYYESIGLIPAATRTTNRYRYYSDADVHVLQFIRRGRDLGFSTDAIMELLTLWQNQDRASADVKRIALNHAAILRQKITTLQVMADTLDHLAAHCNDDHRPDCPIMDDLSAHISAPERFQDKRVDGPKQKANRTLSAPQKSTAARQVAVDIVSLES